MAGIVISGRRPIAGLTNNSESALALMTFSWYKRDGTTGYTMTGALLPISGSLAHSADIRTIKVAGQEVSVIYSNEKITIEIMCVPAGGTGASQLDEALSAAVIPQMGAWCTIANGPALVVDGISSDIFADTAWLYNCDGRLEFADEGEWALRCSLTRRAAITRVAGVLI